VKATPCQVGLQTELSADLRCSLVIVVTAEIFAEQQNAHAATAGAKLKKPEGRQLRV
jgi:hypothetical protein